MTLRAWAFALTLISSHVCAADRQYLSVADEARALNGMEYTIRVQGQRIASQLSCTSEGSATLHINGVTLRDWAYGSFRCQGRAVVALKQVIGRANNNTTWRILDSLVLPRYRANPDPKHPNALRLFETGDCELDGRIDTSFITLVRWGKRDRIDWRTGIEKAWTFDIERGRIVPLSTKRIVCYRPEPA